MQSQNQAVVTEPVFGVPYIKPRNSFRSHLEPTSLSPHTSRLTRDARLTRSYPPKRRRLCIDMRYDSMHGYQCWIMTKGTEQIQPRANVKHQK